MDRKDESLSILIMVAFMIIFFVFLKHYAAVKEKPSVRNADKSSKLIIIDGNSYSCKLINSKKVQ